VVKDRTDITKEPISLGWLGLYDPKLFCNTWNLSWWNSNQKVSKMEVYYDKDQIKQVVIGTNDGLYLSIGLPNKSYLKDTIVIDKKQELVGLYGFTKSEGTKILGLGGLTDTCVGKQVI